MHSLTNCLYCTISAPYFVTLITTTCTCTHSSKMVRINHNVLITRNWGWRGFYNPPSTLTPGMPVQWLCLGVVCILPVCVFVCMSLVCVCLLCVSLVHVCHLSVCACVYVFVYVCVGVLIELHKTNSLTLHFCLAVLSSKFVCVV